MTLVTLLAALACPVPAGAVTAPLLAAIHRNVGYTNTARSARCIPQLRYHWYADDPAHVSARPRILGQWQWLAWQARHAASRCGPVAAIQRVFGAYAGQAIAVARCESGLSVYARNGQYLGLFQTGAYARSTYGFGWTALAQSQAAYRYFVASGRDWSPWTCRP